MKKHYFFIALCITISSEKITAKVFSEALTDFSNAEKDLLELYRQASPNDRPAFKRQMLRAGIAPEQIDAVEPSKVAAPVSAPTAPPAPPAPAPAASATKQEEPTQGTNAELIQARKNLKPIPAPAPKAPSATEIAEAELVKARQNLRKTTPNAPKVFAPLPGKPTEKELQDAIAERARKRELQQ